MSNAAVARAPKLGRALPPPCLLLPRPPARPPRLPCRLASPTRPAARPPARPGRFWGFASVLVDLDQLSGGSDARLMALITKGYR